MAAVESNGAKRPSRSNSLQRMLDLEKQCKMERLKSHQSSSSRPPSTHSNFNRQSRAYSLPQQQYPVVNTSRSRSGAGPLTITVPSQLGDLHERRSRSPTPKSVSFRHSDTHLSDAEFSRSHSSGWEINPEKIRSKRHSVMSERETRDAAKRHPRLTKAPPSNSSRAHAMLERPQPLTATTERSQMVGSESLTDYNTTDMTVSGTGRRSNSITSLATLTNRLQLFNNHPRPQDVGFIGGLKLQQEQGMISRTHEFGSSTTPAETGSFWMPTTSSFGKSHPRASLSSQLPKSGLGDATGQSTTRTTAPLTKWRDSGAATVPISPSCSSGDKEQSATFRTAADLKNDAQGRGHRSTDRLSSSGSQESVSPKLAHYPPSASKTRPGRQERSFSLTRAANGSDNSSERPGASALQSSRRNSFSSIKSTFTLDEGGFLGASSGILKGLKEAARAALKGPKHDSDSSSLSGSSKRRSSFVTPVELAASMGAARAVSGEQLPHPPRPPREFMGFEATGWGSKSTPAVVSQHQQSDQSSVSSYEDSSNSLSTYATPSSSRPGSEKGSPTREKTIGSFGQGPPRLSVLGMVRTQAAVQGELPGDDVASTSRFVSRPPSLGCLPRVLDGEDGLLRQEERSQSSDIDRFVEETWSRSAMNVALAESSAVIRSTEGFKLESPLATLSAQSLVPPPLEIHASTGTGTAARVAEQPKRAASREGSGELSRGFGVSNGSATSLRPGSSESGSGGPVPVLPPRKRGHTADVSARRNDNLVTAPPMHHHQHQSSGAMSAGPALYLETARQLAPAAPPPRSLRRPQPVGPSKSTVATVATAYGRDITLAPGTTPLSKVLVRCCRCEFLHDMPPRLRECLERPDGRVPDRRAGSGAVVSGAVTTVVKCPWCGHGMATGCCAGFVADVFLRERLH